MEQYVKPEMEVVQIQNDAIVTSGTTPDVLAK